MESHKIPRFQTTNHYHICFFSGIPGDNLSSWGLSQLMGMETMVFTGWCTPSYNLVYKPH